jgi:methylmalonyl-CoA carboxyltransferase small subunit
LIFRLQRLVRGVVRSSRHKKTKFLKLKIVIDGKTYEVEVEEAEELGGLDTSAPTASAIQSSVLPSARLSASSDFDESKICRSPLAGVVARLQVTSGQHVQPDEVLVILDAMKMEIKIAAPSAGTIKSIEAAPGDAVKPNQILVCFE